LFGLGTSGFEPIGLILPLGISFYTFQAIAYAIDVYREEIPAEKKFSDFSLFLLFFPQLVAGPIMRASVLIPQFHERKIFSKENLISGLPVVALGIFKKTMIADPIALAISPVYENPAAYDFIAIITATYLFSIQIYCDFAGYSDIAIGIGKIMGFDIPVNFHRPFLSQSITELWKRWHISLSSWLRDYVYIPLGGSKVSKLHNYINVFLTMVIGGIWHGAAWTFVIWGTINGLILIIEKFFIEKKWDRFFAKIPAPIKIVYTFSIFTVGALFFRSETVEKAFLSAGKIFHGASGMSLIPGIEVVIPLLILVLIESSEEAGKDFAPLFNRVPIIKYGLIGSILLIAGMIYTVTVSPQFYYFQF
ncbi:MAG: MBOAT family protein, partial [Leptospira sp.]|nr:MBOAT family protein [Leptospira sp.]